jgi:hypothetical protein
VCLLRGTSWIFQYSLVVPVFLELSRGVAATSDDPMAGHKSALLFRCSCRRVFMWNLHITYVITGSLSDMLNIPPRVFT